MKKRKTHFSRAFPDTRIVRECNARTIDTGTKVCAGTTLHFFIRAGRVILRGARRRNNVSAAGGTGRTRTKSFRLLYVARSQYEIIEAVYATRRRRGNIAYAARPLARPPRLRVFSSAHATIIKNKRCAAAAAAYLCVTHLDDVASSVQRARARIFEKTRGRLPHLRLENGFETVGEPTPKTRKFEKSKSKKKKQKPITEIETKTEKNENRYSKLKSKPKKIISW